MSWEERLKEVLGLPSEARNLSVYRYVVPKGEKTHEYLRCEYTIGEKRKTKHVPRKLERIVEKILEQREREEVAKLLDTLYYNIQRLKAYSLDDDQREQLREVRELLDEAMKLLEESDEV